MGVTFVSSSAGWVLGTAPCAKACFHVLQTLDGGRTWTEAPAPPIALTLGQPGVSSIRFADDRDGWVFGPSLWSTHDGGATWTQVNIPGLPADSIATFEAHHGSITALAYDDASGVRIATSPVDHDAWSLTGPAVDVGAGPVPDPLLVLSDGAGWVVELNRAVIGGARLVNGSWQAWKPPCLDALGPAVLAAATAKDVAAVCDVGVWGPPPPGTPSGERLFVSSDGGQTFVQSATAVPIQVAAVAMPSPSDLHVAGSLHGDGRAVIYASGNGGRPWRETFRGPSDQQFTYIGFTTPSQGVAILSGSNGGNRMLMTRDGGNSWTPVTF